MRQRLNCLGLFIFAIVTLAGERNFASEFIEVLLHRPHLRLACRLGIPAHQRFDARLRSLVELDSNEVGHELQHLGFLSFYFHSRLERWCLPVEVEAGYQIGIIAAALSRATAICPAARPIAAATLPASMAARRLRSTNDNAPSVSSCSTRATMPHTRMSSNRLDVPRTAAIGRARAMTAPANTTPAATLPAAISARSRNGVTAV